MVTYFILPYPPEWWQKSRLGLTIEPEVYRQRLVEEWPGAKTYLAGNDSGYILRWEILEGDSVTLFGGLQRDRQTVSIEAADREALARFAIWHRKLIPRHLPLYLTWEGTWASLGLTDKTTAEDIFRFTGLVA